MTLIGRPFILAWAAGLFEGEGCIAWDARRKRARLMLETTDEDVAHGFHAAFGVGSVRKRKPRPGAPKHHKAVWTWSCGAHKDVRAVLVTLLPYLGARRRAKARGVLGRT